MPIYEYKCLECGMQVEKMQKISDAPLTVCENCGGKLEKQWSLSGFQFKGAGWYVTDYAGKKPDTASSSKSETKSGDSSESKSDSKTEKTSTTESTAKTESASNNMESKSSTKKED